ncbi:MAG: hypothetical protein K0R22_897, partial [Sporomusa sp.]|nr:hypothetical protein [Sporomusa sp.]
YKIAVCVVATGCDKIQIEPIQLVNENMPRRI